MLKHIQLAFFICCCIGTSYGQINFGTTVYNNPLEAYTLLAPVTSSNSYLIDNCGRIMHSWPGTSNSGLGVYLTENGNLLRTENNVLGNISAGGAGGDILLINWEGITIWKYTISNDSVQAHHDLAYLPSGNILAIVWKKINYEQLINSGRNPATLMQGESIWSEAILEIKPTGADQAEIVWEWNIWDHLIQDFDASKPNYGVIKDHPEKFNINNNQTNKPDWLHFNGINYNEEEDIIAFTSRSAGEVYIIDHSTTNDESASSLGGNYGKGGDFLFRWGNPQKYNQGDNDDQILIGCHAPEFVKENGTETSKLIVFNNGYDPANLQSQVLIIETKNEQGEYALDTNGRFLPSNPIWQYESPEIYSLTTSGAQVIDDHILITVGNKGKLIELNQQNEITWTYQNPAGMQIKNQSDPLTRLNANRLFKAYKYPIDYPAFDNRNLVPGPPIETEVNELLCEQLSGTSSIENDAWILFPNPSFGTFTIKVKEGRGFNYSIKNIQGQEVEKGEVKSKSTSSILCAGYYLISINNGTPQPLIIME